MSEAKGILVSAIDVGHGNLKAAMLHFGKLVNDISPSIVSHADLSNPLLNPDVVLNSMVTFDGHSYFTGKLAAAQDESKQIKSRDDSNVASEVWGALFRAALAKQVRRYYQEHKVLPEKIQVVSGLPIEFFNVDSCRENLLEAMNNIKS